MRKPKFKDLHALSQAVVNSIDSNGFSETMRKLTKMFTNFHALLKDAKKSITQDQI
jgi:hypothetical protein